MTTPGELTTFTATPNNSTNGDINTYTYSFTTAIPIEDGDIFGFTIPS